MLQLTTRSMLLAGLSLSLGTLASAQYGNLKSLGGGAINGLVAHDIEGDGDLDILALQGGPAGIFVAYENLGFGDYGTVQAVTSDPLVHAFFRFVDLDQDGQRDLIVSENKGGDNVSWYRALGGLSFAPQEYLGAIGSSASNVAIADLDGDGDLDIAGVSFGSNTIAWLENQGGQAFAPPVLIDNTVAGPSAFEIGDIDGDGKPDLVVGGFNDDRIVWLRNLGGGSFDTVSVISTGSDGPTDLTIADLDGDGDLDVVVCSLQDDEIALYLNQGTGNFASQEVLDVTCLNPRGVSTADVDLDGDLDIIAAAQNGSRYFENLGSGFFGIAQVLPGPSATFAFEAIAFDADGDSDIDIVTNRPGWNPREGSLGTVYCTSVQNSTGDFGVIEVTGGTMASLNSLTLTARDLPQSTFGFFLVSMTDGLVNQPGGSQGVLCLGGNIGRYNNSGQVLFSGVFRRIRLTVDPGQTPTPNGFAVIQAGEMWHYQAWYRDTVSGQPTSNFTDAVRVTFN